MLAEHNGSSKRGIIVKSQRLIKQYLMKSIVLFENLLATDERRYTQIKYKAAIAVAK